MTLLLLMMLSVGAAAPGRAPAAESGRRHTVTLDVKDEDVRVILKSMQQQCGIKNLIVDKEVQGRGTLYFRDLPCDKAFDTVFKTFSLRATTYSNDVVNVAPRSK